MGDQEGIRKGIGLSLVSNDGLCFNVLIQLAPENAPVNNFFADILKYSKVTALWYSVPRFLYDSEEVLARNLVRKGETTKCLFKLS
jgi:hypothetical protein